MLMTGWSPYPIIIYGAWGLLVLCAVWKLRDVPADQTAKAIWAAIVLLIPIAGAVAFLVVWTGKEDGKKRAANRKR